MTVGESITRARKRKNMKMAALAAAVDKSEAAISTYENETRTVDAETIVKIAQALEDDSILHIYLENNPVYKAILPKVFPDLNNIRRDPSAVFTTVAREADEARQGAEFLAGVFVSLNPEKKFPDFDEVFMKQMEQIIDVKRAVETLEFQLLALKIMSKEKLQEIYARQQRKCIEKGHHDPTKTDEVHAA